MRKFYPKINGSSITDVADLRAHFVRDEVLQLYRDGTLRRWLDFFPAEADRAARLDALDPGLAEDDLWAALCGIFGVAEPAEGPAAAPPAPDETPSPEDTLRGRIIQEYLDGYEALMAQIVRHRDDFSALCTDARELEETYRPLFRLQCRGLFPQLQQEAPKAIFAIAARDALRDTWRQVLAAVSEAEAGKKAVKSAKAVSADLLARYCKDSCKDVLGRRCRIWSQRYRGSTQEYFTKWRPADGLPDGVLLLRMDGMRLRSAAAPERVLTDADCCFERVYDPQLCFDGSRYSEGTAHVYYLEV